jgi:hypothetical protein
MENSTTETVEKRDDLSVACEKCAISSSRPFLLLAQNLSWRAMFDGYYGLRMLVVY